MKHRRAVTVVQSLFATSALVFGGFALASAAGLIGNSEAATQAIFLAVVMLLLHELTRLFVGPKQPP